MLKPVVVLSPPPTISEHACCRGANSQGRNDRSRKSRDLRIKIQFPKAKTYSSTGLPPILSTIGACRKDAIITCRPVTHETNTH